ncbi:metal ion ABC transporter substrate-binding protein/surface antigen [Acinetobacter baumannii]|nr:metal ion ABC transporter substrate-binding protein/surface antigen [Acinetobacter baumannii]
MDREHFMDFFRNDEKLEQLTPDDRIEIFLNVLLGSSDIDVKLLNELLNNYALYTTNFTEPLSYQGSAFLKLPKFP